MENKLVFIYTLTDPRTNEIRYVGKTTNIKKRLTSHMSESRNRNRKECWISNLKNNKLLPIIEVLDIVPESEWGFWEIFWINQIKSWGINLINIGTGGESGNMTEETKKRLSLALKGKKSRLGSKWSENQRIKTINSLTGRKLSEEHKLKKAKGCFKEIDVNQLKIEYEKYGNYKSLTTIFNLSESKIYRTLKNNNLIKNKGITQKRKLMCVELNKVYNSLMDVKREFGKINIDGALKNKTKAGGYHWVYVI